MVTKNKPDFSASSHLFTLRIYVDVLDENHNQIRIQVKHVLSGATHTFLQWSQVIAFIEDQLREKG